MRGHAAHTRPWIEHWLETVSDLSELKASHPMMDAVIDEIDGRMIRVGDRWLADFASCNYLGFDLDRDIIDAVPAYLDAWGTHPSWSRLLGSPVLCGIVTFAALLLPGMRDVEGSADGDLGLDARAAAARAVDVQAPVQRLDAVGEAVQA